jgi:hypothetical protein
MKTINLTDEQYNNLTSLISKEALDILNNTSNTSNNESIDNKIIIRVLSSKEYDKHIVNSTCSGAITPNDKNVWNTTQYSGFGYYMIYYSYTPNLYKGLSVLEVSSNTYKVLQNSNYIKDGRGNNNFYGTKNTNMNFELVQNNTSNKNYIKSSYTHIFEALGFIYDGREGVYQYGRLDLNECALTKDATSCASSVNGRGYYAPGQGQYYTTINITCTCNFRPIFHYKDNNKSNNIYC